MGIKEKTHRVIPSKIKRDLTKVPELLDTQVFSGSIQWVLLEISWSDAGHAELNRPRLYVVISQHLPKLMHRHP